MSLSTQIPSVKPLEPEITVVDAPQTSPVTSAAQLSDGAGAQEMDSVDGPPPGLPRARTDSSVSEVSVHVWISCCNM